MDAESVSLLDLPGLRARELAEPGFGYELAEVAQRLGLDPDYIGAVMANESGFKPEATNPHGFATGLIQFMPDTAVRLGTTVDRLRVMTARQQLPFVEAFYRPIAKAIRPAVPGDYYMATFLPAFVGQDSGTVLARKGEQLYDQNAGLDVGHDDVLTIGDVAAKIDATVAAARTRAPLVSKKKPFFQARAAAHGLWFWCWGRLLALRTSGNAGADDAPRSHEGRNLWP